MNTNVEVKRMAVEYDCIHETLIQNHSTDIQSLKTRADYKDKRIDDLYDKMEKMEKKIDKLNDNVNKLVLQSTTNDSQLELRLKAIETELALTKQAQKDNLDTYRFWLSIVTIALTCLTIYLNFFR